jgi:hypothetical protein
VRLFKILKLDKWFQRYGLISKTHFSLAGALFFVAHSTKGLSKPLRCKIGVLEWGVRKGQTHKLLHCKENSSLLSVLAQETLESFSLLIVIALSMGGKALSFLIVIALLCNISTTVASNNYPFEDVTITITYNFIMFSKNGVDL